MEFFKIQEEQREHIISKELMLKRLLEWIRNIQITVYL